MCRAQGLFGLVATVIVFCCWSMQITHVNAQSVHFSDDFYYDTNSDNRPPTTRAKPEQSSSNIQFHEGSPFIEGDECTESERRWSGTCLLASRCPSVLDEYKYNGRKPTICSYQATELVVCCPSGASAQRLPSNNRPFAGIREQIALHRDQSAGNRDGQQAQSSGVRLSQQKCDEYSRLATHTGAFTLLSVITSVDKVDIPTCAYPTGLIVGGIKTKLGEFPHMAVIGWREGDTINWNCGGSLISDRFVLTAGHCAAIRGVRPDVVRLGEQNLVRSDDKANPKDFGIANVITHPDYKTSSHYSDIAVIKLTESVSFNKFIRPACLWQNYDVNSTRAVATGWGQVEFSGSKSDDLLKVPLDIVGNALCSTMYGPSKRLRDGLKPEQMCAGFLSGGKDTCQGDSGGPLQVLTPNNQCIFHIVGVTSFGRACAARNIAGVYTRVSSYLDWIEAVVWRR